MYCRNCGTELREGVSFCPNCGESVAGIVSKNSISQGTVVPYRNSEDALTIEGQIKRIQVADDVIQEVFKYYDKANDEEKAAKTKWWRVFLYWPLLFVDAKYVIVGIPLSLCFLLLGDVGDYLGFIVFIAIMVYGAIKTRKRKKVQRNNARDFRAYAEKLLQENRESIAIIPASYRYPMATSYMREMFESGRVKNLNEALDKYDEYSHRLRMEMGQAAALSEQNRQSAVLTGAAGVSVAVDLISMLVGI